MESQVYDCQTSGNSTFTESIVFYYINDLATESMVPVGTKIKSFLDF